MRRLPKALLWLVPAGLLACAVAIRAPRVLTEAPRPTVNHALHTERDVLCADCHDPDETGTPTLPKSATCFDCHDEKLEGEGERVQAYFNAVRQADGTYLFSRPAYMADLIPAHKEHAGYGVACTDCHGQPSTQAFARPVPTEFMATCMACHEKRGGSLECATCHKETRKDKPPASHNEQWRQVHGHEAPEGWREGQGATCALCHQVPKDCSACHTRTKPASHKTAAFQLHHGSGETDATNMPFAETSCSLCHREESCRECHAVKKPRSHTIPFERRLHGINASTDRETCLVCHKQDTCVRCHQSTPPLSHRGNFTSGAQSHCLQCHEPLPDNGCYVCHKNTLGHLQAPPTPRNAPHNAASDPVDCETCHVTLPHFFDGGSCRRCHR